jgi:hypothetical protein
VPAPPDENVSCPGRADAAATTSAGVFAGLAGGTTITLETPPTNASGLKSFSES